MNSDELYNSFCNEFPLETLSEMPIDRYTNLNKKDSFCYWLEAVTSSLGSIWGGSSYKFGIYKYNVLPKRNDKNYIHDEEYAWLSKYGKTKEEAYANILNNICQIATYASKGEYHEIDNIDIGDAYKWKIAFLYSNKSLISIYNPVMLRTAAEAKGVNDVKTKKVSELQQSLLALKGDKNIFEYSRELWEIAENIIKAHQNTWVYAPGENACFWDDFYNDGIMAIGWDELEDLSQYNNQNEVKKEVQSLYGTDTEKSNGAKACFDFYDKIKNGDAIIVKKGLYEILGYGVVESDYYFDDTAEEFKHRRKVSWEYKGNWNSSITLPLKTLTLKDEKFRTTIMDIITSNKNTNQHEISFMKNLLLYKKQIILQGAPGTGKTYTAKDIAELLIFGSISSKNETQAANLNASKQFKLVQFHPSYTYEDFVRGIEVRTEGGQPEYVSTNRILGRFAEEAFENWRDSNKKPEALSKEKWVEKNLKLFKESLQEKLEKEGTIILKDDCKPKIIAIEEDSFRCNRYDNPNDSVLLKDTDIIYGYIGLYLNDPAVKIKDNSELSKSARSGMYYLYQNLVNLFKEYLDSNKLKIQDVNNDKETISENPYVLIIDEINRANLPVVLGELIYALEYRGENIGGMYAIDGENKLILPPNLFIIGTMNTADRSVGQIDYAIRRRFAFIDMLPQVLESVEGFDVDLFEKVSKLFIENYDEYKNNPKATLKRSVHLSEEFRPEDVWLGHSYFIMQKDGKDCRDMRLHYEIKPILKEYLKDGIFKASAEIEKEIDQLV